MDREGAGVKLELGTDEQRAELVAICEAAIVSEKDWHDRDSQGAQAGVGRAWALLRAGCDFHIHGPDGDPKTTGDTIWLTIWSEGFATVDWGGEREDDLIYLPTRARLKKAEGKDWY